MCFFYEVISHCITWLSPFWFGIFVTFLGVSFTFWIKVVFMLTWDSSQYILLKKWNYYYKSYKRDLQKRINIFSCSWIEFSLRVSAFKLPSLWYIKIKILWFTIKFCDLWLKQSCKKSNKIPICLLTILGVPTLWAKLSEILTVLK